MTSATATRTPITPDDVLSMPDIGRYDALIDGELKERRVSVQSSHTAFEINGELRSFLKESGLGYGFGPDCGLQCFPWDEKRLRFGDGGFYAKERGPRPGHGHLKFAPDLVLEVVSPGDDAEELDQKVEEYLRAGVAVVWVAFPLTRYIQVFRKSGGFSRLGPQDELTDAALLPGFAVRVEDLFLAPLATDDSPPGA